MHALVNHFKLGKNLDREILDKMETELVPRAKAFPGFKDYYLVKVSDLEVIVVVIWDSPESLERSTQEVGAPWFGEKFRPYVAGPPDRKVGEIVVEAHGQA